MKIGVTILLLIGVLSCKKGKTELDLGYGYLPLDSGLTIVYQVRDIFHDQALSPQHDTQFYQIKTIIGESFIDDVGASAFKLRRYYRQTTNDLWSLKDVWTLKNTAKRNEIVEENKRLIDFIFAPSLNQFWDTNVLNNLKSKESQFKSVHQPFYLPNFSFDSTCTVSHQDFFSFVDYSQEYDVFAKGVGKIYSVLKEFTITNFDTLDIVKGIEVEYKMIDYSK